MMAVKKRWKTQ